MVNLQSLLQWQTTHPIIQCLNLQSILQWQTTGSFYVNKSPFHFTLIKFTLVLFWLLAAIHLPLPWQITSPFTFYIAKSPVPFTIAKS